MILTNAASVNGDPYEAVFTNAVGSVTTTAATLTVQAAPAFTSGTPNATVTAGQTYSFTFTASGNPAPTLSAINLPAWLSFNPADGVLSGSSTTAMTYNNLDIIATNVFGSATQTFNLTVTPTAASRFVVSAPGDATVGTAFNFTVTAEDMFGNTATGYNGTVHFTSSDAQAVLPANASLVQGTDTFTATLQTSGNQTLSATDTVTNTVTGTSDSIAVTSAAPAIQPDRVAVFDPTTATWIVDNASTGDPSSADSTFTFGLPGDTAVIGDWNGAGADEIGTYRVDTAITDPITGLHPLVFSLNVTGTGVWNPAAGDQADVVGLEGDTVVNRDWNGAGKDDLGTYRVDTAITDTVSGKQPLIFSLNVTGTGTRDPAGGDQAMVFGLEGDTVVVGDWLGNGKDEIGVVRPGSDGVLVWSLNLTTTAMPTVVATYSFGLNGDVPVFGDWNGDGRTKIGTVRSSGSVLDWSLDVNGDGVYDAGDATDTFGGTGTIALAGSNSSSNSVFAVPLNQANYLSQGGNEPLVGDWNSSGKTEIATYRLASDGQHLLFSFDTNGDGLFDTGDVASQSGLLGGPNAQVFVGPWNSAR